jgi:hypothetical protein
LALDDADFRLHSSVDNNAVCCTIGDQCAGEEDVDLILYGGMIVLFDGFRYFIDRVCFSG